MKFLEITLSLLFISICFLGYSQNVLINNKGLEGQPQHSTGKLLDWVDCGKEEFLGQSPFDIHPGPDGGYWGVKKTPYEGRTYVGLVVRADETFELIGQELTEPLKKNQCYNWSVALAKDKSYRSSVANRKITDLVNFDGEVVMKLWAGSKSCEISELLAESPIISNFEWKEYSFQVKPKDDYSWIIIEAYYVEDEFETYYCNGHLLIDGLSDFIEIDCKDN